MDCWHSGNGIFGAGATGGGISVQESHSRIFLDSGVDGGLSGE